MAEDLPHLPADSPEDAPPGNLRDETSEGAPSLLGEEEPQESRLLNSLEEALAEYHVSLFPEQISLLDQYFRVRNEWNQQINLTRHTDYRKFVARDIVDTLSFARVLQPDEVVLDVGTGGGVPGIILAILRPDLQIVLCECVAKRAKAVADMCQKLNLPMPVLVGKAESFFAQGGWEFHSLVIRAVATLLELMRWFRPYWQFFDRMLLLKGPNWVQERGQARHYGMMHGYALRIVDRYTIPDSEAESVLLQVCPEERLVPPRGCRLRKLRYETLPTGLILPDRPGPLGKPRFRPAEAPGLNKGQPAGTQAAKEKASKASPQAKWSQGGKKKAAFEQTAQSKKTKASPKKAGQPKTSSSTSAPREKPPEDSSSTNPADTRGASSLGPSIPDGPGAV